MVRTAPRKTRSSPAGAWDERSRPVGWDEVPPAAGRAQGSGGTASQPTNWAIRPVARTLPRSSSSSEV
jgi:hypothetical protein